jgi:hypothetical protein
VRDWALGRGGQPLATDADTAVVEMAIARCAAQHADLPPASTDQPQAQAPLAAERTVPMTAFIAKMVAMPADALPGHRRVQLSAEEMRAQRQRSRDGATAATAASTETTTPTVAPASEVRAIALIHACTHTHTHTFTFTNAEADVVAWALVCFLLLWSDRRCRTRRPRRPRQPRRRTCLRRSRCLLVLAVCFLARCVRGRKYGY